MECGHNDNGVYGSYGITSTTIRVYQTASAPADGLWSLGYSTFIPEIPPVLTKADRARAAMREFLGSVRPADLFRPPPVLSAPPTVFRQMVHRRRCQALGPRRPSRLSRA